MILVDNQPVLTLGDSDPRRVWYEKEIAKIKKLGDQIVFKRASYYHLSNGKRRKPPVHAIQSFAELQSERGQELWACCRSYKQRENKTLEFSPNFYHFSKAKHILNPKMDFELIFYMTCIINLNGLGYVVENQEQEAREQNEQEIAELEVRYAIHKHLEDDRLRFHAKAWGISYADKMQAEQLKRTLFDVVKKSHDAYSTTKKGYKEFMDEVQNMTPQITEARAMVNMAMDKSILSIAKTTRKVTYVPAGETICVVPLEYMTRMTDYLADYLLRDKNKDLYDTIRQDVTGVPLEPEPVSVADVERKIIEPTPQPPKPQPPKKQPKKK